MNSQSLTFPPNTSVQDREIINAVSHYTMTSVERQIALIEATRYIIDSKIDGCFVECGVWRGGSCMAIALTILKEDELNRNLYLYDTFEGMTAPTIHDESFDGIPAEKYLNSDKKKKGIFWAVSTYDEVESNIYSTGYSKEKIKLIKGPVEKTLPLSKPDVPIALMRLDTDWYESTKHELNVLFPLLNEGGVLIIDDYGHWKGAKKAVDEYFSNLNDKYYMHRIDYTGRMLIKK